MPKQRSSSTNPAGEPKAKKARFKSHRNDEDEEEQSVNLSQNPDFTAPFEERRAEYGVIEKISVKNFICHGRLDCSFDPHVNFVVGRNGSGKSAILTAIVVGLGGKATATNRGHSVKNFIKDGKNVAEICIKLRNQGDDAYKPHEYGNSIIVERKLRREGGTAYKLKSASGKVISTKREELSHILDHFNIQVDNPVSIMNQETSKSFLMSKNPGDKYKLFLKATQLEQVSNDLTEIIEQERITQDSVDAQSRKLPDLEKEVFALEQKFKDLTCLKDLEDKRTELMHVSAWAQVAELEKERDSKQSVVTKEENRVPKFDDKIEQQQAKVLDAEGMHTRIQGQMEAFGQRLEELSPQHELAQNTKQKSKQTVKALEKEIKQLSSKIRNLESDRDDTLARIQEEKARDKAQFEKERLQREQLITSLLEEKRGLEAQKQGAVREMEQFANAINGAKEESYGLRSREKDISNAINASRRRLQNLEASKKNSLKLYGDYMPALLSEIDKSAASREFHVKPLGPIGRYLKLSDVSWALGVEACLKRTLTAFCCNDHHDTNVLKRIMGRVVPPNTYLPSIITSKFEAHKYDIRHLAVQSQDFPAFLDIVNVSNPVIFNTLVDQRAVENILLIKSSKDARTYLRQHPPKNCREAFTIEGDQVYAGAEQRYYSSMQKAARILRGDIGNEIRETKQDLDDRQRDMDEVRQQSQQLNRVVSENKNLENQAKKQRDRLDSEIRKVNNEMTQLETEGVDEEETNIADLEAEVQHIESQLSQLRVKVERLSRSFKAAHQQHQEAESQFMRMDDMIQEISDQVAPLKDELAQASIEVQTAKQHRKHYEDKKKDLMKIIAEKKKELDKKQREVEETTAKAKRICPERLKVNRKAHNLDSEIKQVTRRIQKEQNKQGDPAAITKEYHDAREKYETVSRHIEVMSSFHRKLDKLLIERCEAFQLMRQSIAMRTKYFFISYMSTRGYSGQLKFDHKNEQLTILVDLGQNAKSGGDVSKDVRSLSGGERSFSTVCLIMALWESVESPFRAMDEFDVFMDMMNRKICIELMVNFAEEQPIRQFIFLTPQDMSKTKPSPYIRILRLHDPERNQTYMTRDTEETQDDDWQTEG